MNMRMKTNINISITRDEITMKIILKMKVGIT